MWLKNLNTDSPQTSIVRLQLDVHLWVQHIKLRKDSRQRWICKKISVRPLDQERFAAGKVQVERLGLVEL